MWKDFLRLDEDCCEIDTINCDVQSIKLLQNQYGLTLISKEKTEE